MWDLWRAAWPWDRFLSEFFGFPLSASFHLSSILMFLLEDDHYSRYWPQFREIVPLHGHESNIIIHQKNAQKWIIRVNTVHPPPKSNPRRPCLGGGNVLGRQTGFWSTEAKVWGIVPKAAWHWGGDSSVTNDPLGAPGSTLSYVCLPPAWGSAACDCLIPWLRRD
jgi:hypothetical protein